MSLFGKVLVLFNIFGAVGVVFLASQSLSKRQELSFAVLQHEVLLDGLPLDEKEMDKDNKTLKERLISGSDRSQYDKLLTELFKTAGGQRVETRVEEVKRLHGVVNDKVQKAGEAEKDTDQARRAQSHELARILLHFAVNNVERDRVRSTLSYMARDTKLFELRKRSTDAFNQAIAPRIKGLAQQGVHDAYLLAVRTLPGEPSDYFDNIVIGLLPDDPQKAKDVNFNDVFSKALEEQLNGLKAWNDSHFNLALGVTPAGGSAPAAEEQKHGVARLMFGLSPYLAEEDLTEADKKLIGKWKVGQIGFAEELPKTDTFRQHVVRVYAVNGLADTLDVITERTFVLRSLADNLKNEMNAEKMQFVVDHAYLLSRLRAVVALILEETARIEDAEGQFKAAKARVTERKDDVEEVDTKLKKTRERSAELSEALGRTSQRLLDARLKVADTIRKTEEAEARLRSLEKLARDVESKGR